ncbi:MAG TPA: universal stress protein [Caulobacteraceae bacterium]|jgi:nucleotide-binding universal stress UspA family protein
MSGPDILVPLDGSERARCALPVAERLSELLKMPVRILQLTDQAGALAEAADRQAGLIVMSAHTAQARPAEGIGPAALAVLRDAPCPVVLVDPARAPQAWTLGRVLVPHDGSPAVSGAVRPAAELAGQAGAELVVLQAAGAEQAAERGSIAPPLYVDQPQHEWPAWSGEFLQRLAIACPLADVRVRLLVGRGEPAEETIRAANDEAADLIVLAWKGHWKPQSAPTLKAVLRAAPCPIMVTRIPAR